MIELFCILEPFQFMQRIKVKINGKDDNDILAQVSSVAESIALAASWKPHAKVYLSGLLEKDLLPFKEEILLLSQTKYSNNNVEVEII
jgi:hypothetical protein